MQYTINQKVKNIVELKTESGELIPVGTILRIVVISCKVCKLKYTDEYHDNNDYFLNMVLDNQTNDYYNRIRSNFCTVKKITKRDLIKA